MCNLEKKWHGNRPVIARGEAHEVTYVLTLKGGRTPEVLTPPRSCPHLIDHIFGERITLILLFARLFY